MTRIVDLLDDVADGSPLDDSPRWDVTTRSGSGIATSDEHWDHDRRQVIDMSTTGYARAVYQSATMASDDHEVELTYWFDSRKSGSSTPVAAAAALLRLQADSSVDINGYEVHVAGQGDGIYVTIYKIVNGSGTTLASFSNVAGPGQFHRNGQVVVRGRVEGDTITAYVNGYEVGSVADSTYPTGRRVGFGHERIISGTDGQPFISGFQAWDSTDTADPLRWNAELEHQVFGNSSDGASGDPSETITLDFAVADGERLLVLAQGEYVPNAIETLTVTDNQPGSGSWVKEQTAVTSAPMFLVAFTKTVSGTGPTTVTLNGGAAGNFWAAGVVVKLQPGWDVETSVSVSGNGYALSDTGTLSSDDKIVFKAAGTDDSRYAQLKWSDLGDDSRWLGKNLAALGAYNVNPQQRSSFAVKYLGTATTAQTAERRTATSIGATLQVVYAKTASGPTTHAYTGALTAAAAVAGTYTVTKPTRAYTGALTAAAAVAGTYTVTKPTRAYTGALTAAAALAGAYSVQGRTSYTGALAAPAVLAGAYSVQGRTSYTGALAAPAVLTGSYSAAGSLAYTGALTAAAALAGSYTVRGVKSYTGALAAPAVLSGSYGSITTVTRPYRGALTATVSGAGLYSVRSRHSYTGALNAHAVLEVDQRATLLSGTAYGLRVEVRYPLVLQRTLGDGTLGSGILGDTPSSGAETWQDITDRVMGAELMRGTQDGSRISPTEQLLLYLRDDDLTFYPFTHLGDVEIPHPMIGDWLRITLHGQPLGQLKIERIVDEHDSPQRIVEVTAFGSQLDLAFTFDHAGISADQTVNLVPLLIALIPTDEAPTLDMTGAPKRLNSCVAQAARDNVSALTLMDTYAATAEAIYDSSRSGEHRLRGWPYAYDDGSAVTIADVAEPGALLATRIRWLADTDALLNTARSVRVEDSVQYEQVDTASRGAVGAFSDRLGFPAQQLNFVASSAERWLTDTLARFSQQLNRPAVIEFDTERDAGWAELLLTLDTGASVLVKRTGFAAQTEYRCLVHGYRLNLQTLRPGYARVKGLLFTQTIEVTI